MKKMDLCLLIGLVVLALFLLIRGRYGAVSGNEVVIYVDGNIYGQYDLTDDRTISINENGHYNLIRIENSSVFMEDANCSNKICMAEGAIKLNNEVICCAPNKVIVVVNSKDMGDYDAITQ